MHPQSIPVGNIQFNTSLNPFPNDIPRPPPRRDPLEGYCFDEFEPPVESHEDTPSLLSPHPKPLLANTEPVIPGLDTTKSFPTSTPSSDLSSGIVASTNETTHANAVDVRTDLANRPTEPMLVPFRTRYTKLWGNRGFLQSGSRQTTPVRVGVTCGSGISVVRVGRK